MLPFSSVSSTALLSFPVSKIDIELNLLWAELSIIAGIVELSIVSGITGLGFTLFILTKTGSDIVEMLFESNACILI